MKELPDVVTLATTPAEKWDEILGDISPKEVRALEDTADALCVALARFSAYLFMHKAGKTGNADVQESLRIAEKVSLDVYHALGYITK